MKIISLTLIFCIGAIALVIYRQQVLDTRFAEELARQNAILAVPHPTTTPEEKPTEKTGTTSTPTREIVPILIATSSSPSKKTPTTTATMTPPSPQKPIAESPIVKQKPLQWGVFSGSNAAAIAQFEDQVEENPDYLAYFVHWANDNGKLPAWLKSVAGDKDRTLVIFWEASDYTIGGTDQPKYAYRTILDHKHDAYIESFSEQLRAYKDPLILIPFSELNGNWTPWSGTKNGNTPEEAVAAFRYVHGFFDDVPNVKFGLALNAASVPDTPENALTAYYPGDDYVDYIGLDGFNMGNPWLSFNDIFSKGLATLSQYNKPLFIFSFASAQGTLKATWLEDAFARMAAYPKFEGFIYFNQNKERNWLLWSDKETLRVFTNYVESL